MVLNWGFIPLFVFSRYNKNMIKFQKLGLRIENLLEKNY